MNGIRLIAAVRRRPRERSHLLARHGYLFTASLSEAERRSLYDGGAVEIGLLGRPALVVTGDAGVELFYDEDLMERHKAVPAPVGLSLFGPGAVHSLDGEAHRHRKTLFRHALSEEEVGRLSGIAERRWREQMDRWNGAGQIYTSAVEVFGASIIEWAGIAEAEEAKRRHGRWLAAIVDGFGVVGPAYLKAVAARRRCDRWAAELILHERAHHDADPDSWVARVAAFADLDGRPLPEQVAAVELLNVLRPTVAVAWLASFAAVALVEHPQWRERIRDREPGVAEAFAHEVRRYYPFVPVLAARTRRDIEHAGHRLPEGRRVLLDVWGTNHGEEWDEPWAFSPERFLHTDPCSITHFVPQGGGPVDTGHRCPGEGVANALLVTTIRLLADAGDLDLPAQDRGFSMRRMPTRPVSGALVELSR